MITWFDSVAAYAPVASANGNRVSRVAWFYAGVWLVVVAFGSWRLAQPPLTGTVRVAGIHVYDHQKMEQLWQSYSTNQAGLRASADSII